MYIYYYDYIDTRGGKNNQKINSILGNGMRRVYKPKPADRSISVHFEGSYPINENEQYQYIITILLLWQHSHGAV